MSSHATDRSVYAKSSSSSSSLNNMLGTVTVVESDLTLHLLSKAHELVDRVTNIDVGASV